MNNFKKIALLTVCATLSMQSVHANDAQDQAYIESAVSQLRTDDTTLPGSVTEQKGMVGSLLSRLFDNAGKIKFMYIDISDIYNNLVTNQLVRFNGTGFVQSTIRDNGSVIGVGGGVNPSFIANFVGNVNVTGNITGATPTATGHLATKAYVDSNSGIWSLNSGKAEFSQSNDTTSVGYPGITHNTNTTGGWARRLGFGSNGTERGHFGALGSNNTLTYLFMDARGSATPHSGSQLVLRPTGRVGIGETNPGATLEVADTAIISSNGDATLTIEADKDNITETDNPSIAFIQDGGAVNGRIGYASGSNSMEFVNEYNGALSLGTSNTTRLSISGAGVIDANNNIIEGVGDPDSGDDAMDRDYADARFVNIGEAIDGDTITDGTIDSSEIQDNSITEDDISDSFVARDANLLDGVNSTSFIRSDAADNVTADTEWQDSQEVRLGNGADMRLFHNGTNSYIRNYTGNTEFRSLSHGSSMYFQGEDAGGTNRNMIQMDPDNEVRLYYAGTEKLNTSSAGIDVAGTVTASDPTATNHLTTKSYVDNLVQGIVWKEPNATSQTCNSTREGWATYQTSDNAVYVCNGTAWVNIGNTAVIPNATTTSPGQIQISGVLGGTWNNVTLDDNTINSAKIVDATITAADLANGSVAAAEIQDGQVRTQEIANNTITETDISDSFIARSASKTNASAYHWIGDLNASPRSMHDEGLSVGLVSAAVDNAPIAYGSLVNFPSYTTGQDGGAGQIIFPYSTSYTQNGNPMFRVGDHDNQGWESWKTFLDKDWADTSYIGIGDAIPGDTITDGTIDSSEIENNTITTSDILNNTITEDDIVNSFVARDSNLLDGINSTSFLRADLDDTHTNKIIVGDTNQRRAGMYGIYDSTKIGHIWSMGTAYQIPEDGSDFGNLYGFGYKHTNNTTGGSMASGHQAVWAQNGNGTSAMGTNIWTSGAYVSDGTTVINSSAYVVGDRIEQNSVDSSEIQNNTLTAADIATNAVGNLELIDAPTVTDVIINAGDGNGINFWNSASTYSFDMGSSAEYNYGPVTGHSIKTGMSNTAGRGFTWGVSGATPTVGIEATTGNAQFAGILQSSNIQSTIGGTVGNPKVALTGLGVSSLKTNTTGSFNTGIGAHSLEFNTTGNFNTGVGSYSLYRNIGGMGNVASGHNSLGYNETGDFNVSQGVNSLYNNVSGSNNTAIGHLALEDNIAANYNTAIGWESMKNHVSGNGNAALGANSLRDNATGAENLATGVGAMEQNTGGSQNTAIGKNAMRLSSGSENIAIGYEPLNNISGNRNIGIGWRAGNLMTSGTQNIIIGYQAEPNSPSASNQLSIGNLIYGTGVNGQGTGISTGNIGIGVKNPTQKLHVNGNILATAFLYSSDETLKTGISTIENPLETIEKLRGVDFTWKEDGKKDVGFIAQELEQVLPELVATSEETGLKSVQYGNITAVLVEGIKELKDSSEQQKQDIDTLMEIVKIQQEQIKQLQSK